MSEFYIMNKDVPVLIFSDNLNMNGNYIIKETINYDMLPYILKHEVGELKDWFKSRAIPANRNHLEKLIESLQLEEDPTAFDYLKLNNGFSLNDSYWIKPLDSSDMFPLDLCWSKHNLYDNRFEKIIEWMPKEFRQDFLDMIVFDYIIENKDRHLGNFGFIIDNNTQKLISFAPLFDQGYALMSNAMPEDFNKDLIKYSESHPSFYLKNKDLAKYVIEQNKSNQDINALVKF